MQNNSSYLNDEIKGIVHQFWIYGIFFMPPERNKRSKADLYAKKNTKFNFNFEIKHNFNTMSLWIHRKKNSWTHLCSGLSLKKIEVHNNTIIKAQLICTQRTKNLAQVHRLTIADCNKTHLNQIIVEKQQICV